MQLSSLLGVLRAARLPVCDPTRPVRALCTDSRKAEPGDLFVCLRGPREDGHRYAADAYARGCRAFVCEYPPPGLPAEACVTYVPDSRVALASLAAAFYGHPEEALTLIGITGTKGKTTTAVMLYRLLLRAGIPVGYIGSLGVWYAGREEEGVNTTPAITDLCRIFSAMRAAGVRTVVMEVSSQALCCERVAGLTFPLTIYTNLAADHVGEGEHPDHAHYRAAKARLFSDFSCRTMVANLDDESAPFMIGGSSARRVLTVSARGDGAADYTAAHIRPVRRGVAFATTFYLCRRGGAEIPVTLPLPGECNVSDALLALAAAEAYLTEWEGREGDTLRALAYGLCDIRVPGRFETVAIPGTGADFLIDYAHNGFSMAAAIAALRLYAPAHLVCLFGSVGGRTYSRRADLARAACAADFCIVTSDNPDTETPEETMREICTVLEENGREYTAIPDRAQAVRYAVLHARPGDVVLLCGKGQERYQLIDGRRVPFSEKECLLAAGEELARHAVL